MSSLVAALVGSGHARRSMSDAASTLLRGVLDGPRRLLDVVDRDLVAGRRASLRHGRAMIEVRELAGAEGAVCARLVEGVEAVAGVRWAGFNAPLCRLIVTCDDPPPALADLVSVVDRVVAALDDPTAAPGPAEPGWAPPIPVDGSAVARAMWGMLVTGTGLALSGVTRLPGVPSLAPELATLVTVVDNQPRLRSVLVRTVGRAGADVTLTTLSALGLGLAGGRTGLVVDGAYRLQALAEARAARAARQARPELLISMAPEEAPEPVSRERPRPLPDGPVERWADRAAASGLVAAAVSLPLIGGPRRAANLALVAVPKAARLGREGFAATLGTLLARRGAVVLDPDALRLLDRVDTVVLDGEVLGSGRLILGQVETLPGVDRAEITVQLYRLVQPDSTADAVEADGWRVSAFCGRSNTGDGHRRAAAAQVERAGAVRLLEVTRAGRPAAIAGLVPEASEAVDALAAAARRSGARLIVAGTPPPDTCLPGDRMPGGRSGLRATVQQLQARGGVVLLVSANPAALGCADIGVGVSRAGIAPRGAHVLVGSDLEPAASLIEACGLAGAVSRRAVRFAQAGSALGAAGVLLGPRLGRPSRPAQAAGLAVNVAAAAALADGSWAARRVINRPPLPRTSRTAWHAMPPATVLQRLATTAAGLSAAEADRRASPESEPAPPGLLQAVLEELNNPLTPVLVGGAAVSAVVGSLVDAGLVAAVTLLSALIGGLQRQRTDRAVAELLAHSAVTASVRRDGELREVAAAQLVVGDVVELHAGQVVPADCRILDAVGLQVDEAALTGEPFPVGKFPDAVIATAVAERTCMLYEGTSIAAGRVTAVVVATGSATEVGRSMAAARAVAPSTGVEHRLQAITRTTLPIALGSAVAVVGAGLLRGRPLRDSLGAGVSLAVASVPEGLPFLVNAAQLASARRLSLVGALVRNPRTIEAIGRVDTLCFDKTGTLTQGRITLAVIDDGAVTRTIDELGAEHRAVLAAALRATPAPRGHRHATHPTDRAVTEAADDLGLDRGGGQSDWRRSAVLPFEPSRGYHATLVDTDGTGVLSVKGAPETVLPRCRRLQVRGRTLRFGPRRQRQIRRRVDVLAGRGYRVLAVAERAASRCDEFSDAQVDDLTLLGFLALTDPVRPAATSSVPALRAAGVQIVMITGDHPRTAEAVARRLDVLGGGRVITGPELDELDDAALDRLLPAVTVVARGTPTHKTRVVQAFRRVGRTVAMTGDGANDAAAIRIADVGIALGRRATPAARAAADLVITDDRLETILTALVEGRSMWAAVREALGILVGGNLGEIAFTVFGAALTGTSPLSTRQLLLVNLLTDLAPALSVALRPPDPATTPTLLAEGPEQSLGTALTREITRRAATTALATTAAWTAARLTGRATRARTIALAALVGSQLGQTVALAGPSRGVLISGIGSAAILVAVIQTPVVSQFFGCTPLGPLGWSISAAASAAATAATLLTQSKGSLPDPQGG